MNDKFNTKFETASSNKKAPNHIFNFVQNNINYMITLTGHDWVSEPVKTQYLKTISDTAKSLASSDNKIAHFSLAGIVVPNTDNLINADEGSINVQVLLDDGNSLLPITINVRLDINGHPQGIGRMGVLLKMDMKRLN